MLVLSRKPGEKIHIGRHITVTVVETAYGRVRLGIDAPDDVEVLRNELVDRPGVKKRPGLIDRVGVSLGV